MCVVVIFYCFVPNESKNYWQPMSHWRVTKECLNTHALVILCVANKCESNRRSITCMVAN